ncbi:hypothetical protein OH77DRAFT_1049762 [Trametes cingulata]|nr:hypothetical protein OH77DRAFT_1049762 [Trametes cingulata]
MDGKITIISCDDFLAEFVPTTAAPRPEGSSKIFSKLDQQTVEAKMYGPLMDAINDAGICPGFSCVTTATKGDKKSGSSQAIDCGIYSEGNAPRSVVNKDGTLGSPPTDWSTIELSIECKTHSKLRDPFEEAPSHPNPATILRKETLGQILSYSQFVFQHQHRTFHFMILFLGDNARILRIDRSGIFATKKFNYKTHGEPLAEFLWRFSHLAPAERGVDTTAELVPRDSVYGKLMKQKARSAPDDHARARFRESLEGEDWPWWLLHVKDEHTRKDRRFLVGKPHFTAFGLAGRGTRGYVAVDADNAEAPFVHLKDAWRVMHDEIDKEGAILQELNHKKVPYVPTLLHHGDLGQTTRSSDLWRKYNPKAPSDQICPMKKHSHYRLVVKEVGKPLTEFTNSTELLLALYCCLKAHAKAYEAGIIHRDISAGNILLYPNKKGVWCGLLNDWELSKKVVDKAPQGRQPDRTGTWQFLSAQALSDPTKLIVVQDELESFFHVALYIAIRFLPHNCDDDSVGRLLYHYFDAHQKTDRGHSCGEMKLASMRNGEVVFLQGGRSTHLQFLWSTGSSIDHPLNKVFKTLLTWFQAYYQVTHDARKLNERSDNLRSSCMDGKSGTEDANILEILNDSDDDDDNDAEDRRYRDDVRSMRNGTLEASLIPDSRRPGEVSSAGFEDLELSRRHELALKLQDHRAMLKLLKEAFTYSWPQADKGDDKRPEKGYNPDSELDPFMVEIQSSIVRSILGKRESELQDSLEPPSTPKRAKQSPEQYYPTSI